MEIIENSNLPNRATTLSVAPGREAPVLDLGCATLYVYILYEDFGAGSRAKQALDRLSHRFTRETDFECTLWQFDLLHLPMLRQIATRRALEADILMVAANARRGLPPVVRSWLEEWFRGSVESPRAVVLSLDAEDRDSSAADRIITPIKSSALRSGVEFFVHLDEPPAPPREQLFAELPLDDAPPAWLPASSQPRVEHYAHWGIND